MWEHEHRTRQYIESVLSERENINTFNDMIWTNNNENSIEARANSQ